jgi:hypothetical protein
VLAIGIHDEHMREAFFVGHSQGVQNGATFARVFIESQEAHPIERKGFDFTITSIRARINDHPNITPRFTSIDDSPNELRAAVIARKQNQ